MTTELYLVRHGETEWNRAGLWQGHSDSPLTVNGIAQASLLGERFAKEATRFDAIYCSDLGRARHTCELLTKPIAQHNQVRLLPSIRERALGHLEGLTIEEIAQRYPDEADLHSSGDPHFAPLGGGESWSATFARSCAALRQIAREHSGQRVLAVTHGGIVGMLLRDCLGLHLLPPRRFEIPNAALNIFLYQNHQWSLRTWGDTSHFNEISLDEVVK